MYLAEKEITKFADWLRNCGAEVIAPTNEWELLRIVAKNQTLVAYRNSRGEQTWPKALVTFWEQKKKGIAPQLGNPQNHLRGNRLARIKKLADRDDWQCWFCGRPLCPPDRPPKEGETAATIEELCPRQVGGPTHIKNQTLACRDCNVLAGNLSVVEKVALREKLRGMAHRETK